MKLRRTVSITVLICLLLAIPFGCALAEGNDEPEGTPPPVRNTNRIIRKAGETPTPKPTSTPMPAATPAPFSRLAPTVDMSFAELVGDDGLYDLPKGYPKKDTYKIIVDLTHQVVMVYEKDAKGEYTVPVRYMLCSSGANDCTPKGTFEMGAYRVRFSKFARDGRYGQYWTQIRKAIYFHTILYTGKDAATYQDFIFNRLGQMDSHGCIRLTVPDARWIWYHIAPGSICVIRDGDKNDKATAAIRRQLVLAKPPAEQLKLEPGRIPNTDNWRIADIPLEEKFVQGSQNGARNGKRISSSQS